MKKYKLKLAKLLRSWADKLSLTTNEVVHEAKNIKDHGYSNHKDLVEKLVKLAKMTGWTYQLWNPESYYIRIWKNTYTEKGKVKLDVYYKKNSTINNFNLTIVVSKGEKQIVNKDVNRKEYVNLLKNTVK